MRKIRIKNFFWLPLILLLWVTAPVLAQSPGGVSTNLNLWLKADAGVTTGTGGVSTWADQSGNGNNASQSNTSYRPDFVSNAINFDPGIDFVEANKDGFVIADDATLETSTFTIFSVFAPDGTSQFDAIIAKHSNSYPGNGYGLQYFPDGNSIKMIANPNNDYPNFSTRSATVDVTGIPQLIGGIYTGSQLEAFTNDASSTYSYSTAITNNADQVTIGTDHTDVGSMDNIDGDIAELIFYGGTLTSTEKNKVESYLATKYGLTLTHDYLNSSGTTIWDVTTNATYSYDITGIGRDDGSGLNQKQSMSVNDDALIAMGLTTIATTNALNGNSFSADNSFLIWGNNDASYYAYSESYNGGADMGLKRIWKVAESGTVGTVMVRVLKTSLPAGASDILVSTSSSFPGGSTKYALSDDGTYLSASINFSNNDFFTFVGTATSSVAATQALWIKADAGTSSTTDGVAISSWNDQSGNSKNASQGTASQRPIYRSNTADNMNFNPVVEYDGTDDYMSGTSGGYSKGYYLVLKNDDQISNALSGQVPFGLNCSACSENWGGLGFGSLTGSFTNEVVTHLVGGTTDYRSAQTGSTTYASGSSLLFGSKTNLSNTRQDLYFNGTDIDNDYDDELITISNSAYYLGRSSTTNAWGYTNYFDGDIAEVISYSTTPSEGDHLKIQSYLATKYAISLSTDYLASDGTSFWSQAGNSGFTNSITGIGRDDYFSLNQKQSMSSNSDGLVTIGLGTIATDNATNGNTFSADKTYMFWGNNGGDISSFNQSYNGGANTGVARIWKIEETATVGSVKLRFLKTSLPGATDILVSSNSSFPGGSTTVTALSDDGTYFHVTLNFADGEYFTFGGANVGSTSIDPQLWLKADVGTSTTTSGNAVSAWNDQSGNANNASQGTGGNQPTFYNSSADNINYNPMIDFDGSTDYMTGSAGAYSRGYYMVLEHDDVVDDFLSGGGDGQMPFGWDCSSCANDFGGFGLGGMTGAFANEVLTHLAGNSGEWRSAYNSTVASYASGSVSIFAAKDNAVPNGTDIFRNGTELDNVTAGSLINIPNEAYSIGRARPSNFYGLTMYYDGKIAELLTYSTRPTDTDHSKIQSYLAIKYGITLPINYVAASNTEIWNVTTNASYGNNITAIGRDDFFGLDQRQSISTSGGIVTFGLGSVASINSSNGNSFSANESFMAWGNNGGSVASYTGSYNGGTLNGVARIWKVEEIGTVGDVEIKVAKADLVANVTFLYVSTDPTFPEGSTTEITLSDDATYLTTTRDFADGEYFTFGYEAPPAITATKTLWLKADAGTSTTTDGVAVSTWNDQSASSNNASQGTGSAQPIYRSNTTDNINFNPVVDFDGSLQYMTGTAGAYTRGYYLVLKNDDLINKDLSGQIAFGIECTACTNDFAGLGFGSVTSAFTDEVITHMVGSSADWRSALNNNSTSYSAGSVSLFAVKDNAGATGTDIYRNATEVDNATAGSIISVINEQYSIGIAEPGNTYGLTMPFDGKIAELMSFSARPSDLDHSKIQTYLGLKYSIELSVDYYSGNGSKIWDLTANSTYSNDIAGIGREDLFGFNQKQSMSRGADAILTIGLGSIETDNASNANTFSADEQYFIWGNNNGNLYSDGETDIGTTLNPEVIVARIGRVWKAEEVGSVSTTHLKFDMSAIPGVGGVDGENDLANVRLLVDVDGVFANDATSVSPTSYNNTTDIVEFDHDFAAGTGFYFTIGSVNGSTSPLPVSYLSFEAKAQKEHVDLFWVTATEVNNSHFEVERSTDTKNWIFVTKIQGAGNSTMVKNYKAKDMAPVLGVNYYRLKQVDFDGKFEYSNIVSVNFDEARFELLLYPNPVRNTINLFSDVTLQYAAINLVSPYGQLIPAVINFVNDNEVTMDVSDAAPGIYYLRISNFGQSITKKVVIAR